MGKATEERQPHKRIWLPLDNMDEDQVTRAVENLHAVVGTFKIGLELSTEVGTPHAVELVREAGGRSIFLDNKFNDIPRTVGRAAAAAARRGVDFFNVHASCGMTALSAAVNNAGDSRVLGVTVLTSLDDEDCTSIFGDTVSEKVLQFAYDLFNAGVDGIICAPWEVDLIVQAGFGDFIIVTPGIRPTWAQSNDQKRIMTPAQAIGVGADYLVCGSPITKPPKEIGDSVEAAMHIADEIRQALNKEAP